MDDQWCIRELQLFLEALERYSRHRGIDQEKVRAEVADELLTRSPAIERILRATLGEAGKRYQLSRDVDGRVYNIYGSHDIVFRALGTLQRGADLDRALAPDVPRMDADHLHPWVWDAARSLWETQHYRAAVQAASTSLNAHVQALVQRRDVSDLSLMSECFSSKDPEPGKPRLRWPGDPADESVRSMQNGLRLFAQGVFGAVRNPATHNLDEIDEHEALERLASLSLLARWIESCDQIVATA